MREAKYVILGIENCPFCVKAKALLEGIGKNYTYFDLEAPENKALSDFYVANDFTTVPVIYEDGALIGGYNDLRARFVSVV